MAWRGVAGCVRQPCSLSRAPEPQRAARRGEGPGYGVAWRGAARRGAVAAVARGSAITTGKSRAGGNVSSRCDTAALSDG